MEAEALVEQLEQQQPHKSRKGRATKTPGKGFAPSAPETMTQKSPKPSSDETQSAALGQSKEKGEAGGSKQEKGVTSSAAAGADSVAAAPAPAAGAGAGGNGERDSRVEGLVAEELEAAGAPLTGQELLAAAEKAAAAGVHEAAVHPKPGVTDVLPDVTWVTHVGTGLAGEKVAEEREGGVVGREGGGGASEEVGGDGGRVRAPVGAAAAGGGGGDPSVTKGLVKVMVHPFQDIFMRKWGRSEREGEGGKGGRPESRDGGEGRKGQGVKGERW
jgi:hypothetical protein